MIPESELIGVELFKTVAPFKVIVTLPKSSSVVGLTTVGGSAYVGAGA